MITAKVTVTFKEGVLDPQGKTIFNALHDLGYDDIRSVSTGKVFRLVTNQSSKEVAIKKIDEICRKLLANPVIEQYKIEIEQ